MKKYNRYKFKSGAKVVRGDNPAFFKLLIKNVNKKTVALDMGCGSGELTIQLSKYCRKIFGIDYCAEYIKTANEDKITKKIKNVVFKVGDGRKLLFKDNTFDLVYSSRGPLSANSNFFREALRVLKPGGRLIEETIGETDKMELKQIFKRGQNFPVTIKKRESVLRLINKFKAQPVFFKEFVYFQKFPSLSVVINTLERAPIIPNFNKNKDASSLAKVELLYKNGGIILRAHRLWWAAKKKEIKD